MEDLPLGRIAALVPEFAVKDLPLGQNTDDDINSIQSGWTSSSSGKARFDPGCWRGGDFSSLLCVQTGPGVHSASYKMSTGEFPQG